MFREMRRKRQQLSNDEAAMILKNGTSGVLALSGDDGYPYAVPMSYIYRDGRVYFHCAKTGHKLSAIENSDKASFCVVAQDEVIPDKYTTYFRSAIAFGRIRVMEDGEEKREAIDALAAKYSPGNAETRRSEIEREFPALCLLELTIEHLSGKEAIELTRARDEK